MIDHLLTESWTVLKNTESVDSSSTVVDSWSTDTSIGTSGVITAHFRNLSLNEIKQNESNEIVVDSRLYTENSGLTTKHRLKNSSNQIYNIMAVDNPHNLNEFYQVDLLREQSEVNADG